MPSPFPGMDPFIEADDRWPDFHMTFMTTCREQLLTRLPANYDARLEERMQLPTGDYFAIVSRRERYPMCEAYAWSIRRKLPKILIPLVSPDADVPLELAEAFATTFDRGGYGRSLRYDQSLASTLGAGDREWALTIAKSVVK